MGGHLNINHLMFLGQGALWTIGLSVIALIGGGILGFVIALARISPLRGVRFPYWTKARRIRPLTYY